MIEKNIFLHQEWFWFAVLSGLFMWIFFLWKEWWVSGSKRFTLKAIVSLGAVISLVLIALQPLEERAKAKGVGVLLTQGYENQILDSLKTLYQGIKVVPYQENVILRSSLDSIGNMYVLGDGIAVYDFWQFVDRRVSYLGGETLSGIVRLQYDQEISLGDSLKLRGMYKNPLETKKLILRDAGGNDLDSLSIEKEEDKSFMLTALTNVAGSYVYSLVEKDSLGKVVRSNPVPVLVKGVESLSILVLNANPTFETKYLKNFLATNGHSVLARSQLTKDRFKFESFNRGSGAVYTLTSKNLKNFDLIILDGASFLNLGASSKRALLQAVQESGLGVFIQPELTVFGVSQGRSGFRFKRNERKTIRLEQWPKIDIQTYSAAFQDEVLLQPSLSSQNQVLSAFKQKGLGRLGTSVLKDTYELVLAGYQETYSYIWTKVLTDLTRSKKSLVNWESSTFLNYEDVAYDFRLKTAIEQPAVYTGDRERIALRGDVDRSYLWSGRVYPKRSGWHTLNLQQDSTSVFKYYTFDSLNWRAMSRHLRVQQNKRHFQNSVEASKEIVDYVPIDRFWLFIIVVMSMGFLWFEPRFLS